MPESDWAGWPPDALPVGLDQAALPLGDSHPPALPVIGEFRPVRPDGHRDDLILRVSLEPPRSDSVRLRPGLASSLPQVPPRSREHRDRYIHQIRAEERRHRRATVDPPDALPSDPKDEHHRPYAAPEVRVPAQRREEQVRDTATAPALRGDIGCLWSRRPFDRRRRGGRSARLAVMALDGSLRLHDLPDLLRGGGLRSSAHGDTIWMPPQHQRPVTTAHRWRGGAGSKSEAAVGSHER